MSDALCWDDRPDSQDIVARYASIATCQISDSMRALGIPYEGLFGVTPIDDSTHIAGPAFTVSCLPASESVHIRIEYLQEIPAGSVVVIANGGRVDCSMWGGQRTLAAKQRGAVGTVVDGAYRDIPEHLAMAYPVFGLRRTVVSSVGLSNPVRIGEAVTVAGVMVYPRDLVVGDASGVVVVPAGRVLEVLAHGEESTRVERKIIDAVASGSDYFLAKKEISEGG